VGKFIIIAFGFLGFAFYELSGGSDFDGEALRLSRVDTSSIQKGLPKITVAESMMADTPTNLAVTRAAFSMVSTDNLAAQAEITQDSSAPTQDEDPASAIVLPSLIASSQSVATSQVPLTANDQDLRLVTGNLVNVRGGPGTHFDVVGKLTLGAEVVVLAENGDGWVEMRSLDGATLGWMADFLLNEG
jgi:hypothetical protein